MGQTVARSHARPSRHAGVPDHGTHGCVKVSDCKTSVMKLMLAKQKRGPRGLVIPILQTFEPLKRHFVNQAYNGSPFNFFK